MAPEHAGGAPQAGRGSRPGEAAPVFKPPRAPFLDVLGKLSQRRTVVLGIVGVIVFFAVWEVAHYATPEEKQRFLPSVELVVGQIIYLFAEKNFIADVGTSLYRIYASFFAASLIAVPLGVLMGGILIIGVLGVLTDIMFRLASRALFPYLRVRR